jgi:hypothetical protein
LPAASVRRALLALHQKPKPVAGLDCASCHY